MTLEEAKEDYEIRSYKKFRRFRKCNNCKFSSYTQYDYTCQVKEKSILFELSALICRYYTKI